jgi:hypothetical protein
MLSPAVSVAHSGGSDNDLLEVGVSLHFRY